MMPSFVQRAALVSLLAAAILGLAACDGSAAAGPSARLDQAGPADQLVSLTNVSRTSNGLPGLPRDNRLSVVGVSRSEDMIARNYFAHEIPPDGRTVVDLLESLGVGFKAAGENIAWNNALEFTTVQTASDDFMNSPSHRKNVLEPRWNRVGAGVAAGSDRRMYTVLFMDVADTAAPAQGSPVIQPDRRPMPDPLSRGERVRIAASGSGLLENLINRLLRLFLNL